MFLEWQTLRITSVLCKEMRAAQKKKSDLEKHSIEQQQQQQNKVNSSTWHSKTFARLK